MDAADVLRLLVATSVAGSVSALLVAACARPLRRWAGAGCAYRAWWAVPLAMCAALLPAREVTSAAAPAEALGMPSANAGPTTDALATQMLPSGLDWPLALLSIWGLGIAVVLIAQVVGHRRFAAGLGPLRRRRDGLFGAETSEGLPAVVGLRARIVLPADFETRYSPDEQALVLAHERVHVRHRDVWWNLLATLLCAAHWFNPVGWWALRRLCRDQELACDAAVLAARPDSRRRYAEALLKSGTCLQSRTLACQWPASHPLKERIEVLGQIIPGRRRRAAGTAVVMVAGSMLTLGVWAAQPPRTVAADAVHVETENVGPMAPVDPAPLSGRAAAERAAAAAGLRLRDADALDGAPTRPWLERETPARAIIMAVAASRGLDVVPDGDGLRLVAQGPTRVEYDAGSRTLDVQLKDVPVGDALRRIADATGRRFETANGVSLTQPVSMRMQSVPLATVEALIDGELDGARLESDAAALRVVAAPEKRGRAPRKPPLR